MTRTATALTAFAAILVGIACPVAGYSMLAVLAGLALIAAVTIAGPVIQAVELAFRERISFREAWRRGAE